MSSPPQNLVGGRATVMALEPLGPRLRSLKIVWSKVRCCSRVAVPLNLCPWVCRPYVSNTHYVLCPGGRPGARWLV